MQRASDATGPNVARGLGSADDRSRRIPVVAGAAALGVFLFFARIVDEAG
jgi:hypothetical protein